LVILGFPTLAILVWQAIASSRAAKAAFLNALAAKQAVEVVISKERFRISVTVDPLHLNFQRDPVSEEVVLNPANPQGVGYGINFYGLTEGFILDGSARSCVTSSEEPPRDAAFPMRHLPTRALVLPSNPETSYRGGFALMYPRMGAISDMFDVVEGRKFIHFWGRIRYRDAFFDAFRQERETAFRWIWRFTGNPEDIPTPTPLGGRFGRWFKCGGPEDNRET